MPRVALFDSSLRDGAQAEGITFSVEDKIKILQSLDALGIDYVEAGNPTSNPKDLEFFQRVRGMKLQKARIVAFGSTCHKNCDPAEDMYVNSLLSAQTQAVAIFGKSWDFHVTDIIQTTLEENLRMIRETIRYVKSRDREVIFDAEHFFDGYKASARYAMEALAAAAEGGADCLVLCDTNGGTMPDEIRRIVAAVRARFPKQSVGIHCHNDCGMAVGNSIEAVLAGADHVQGTFLGFGERCGNASLCTILGNLQLKMGYECIPAEKMIELTQTARYIAEVANITLTEKEPYIGRSSFSHKGGMHIDGVNKNPKSFEHIPPETVGNSRRFLMSEVAGRGYLLNKLQKLMPGLTKESEETKRMMERLKELEHEGYQFEGAESSFELRVRKELGRYRPFFEIEDFKIIGEEGRGEAGFSSYAMVKVRVDDEIKVTAAEGDGTVNALDKALRQSLEGFFPALRNIYLTDYKVRILDTREATAAIVRVLIETTDGKEKWSTIGVSTDIIDASLRALVDSLEIKLIKDVEQHVTF